MKLDHLLAPYLYQHKTLSLPGIGTFEADSSLIVPEDNEKNHTQVQGITFKQRSDIDPDYKLIDYIKAQTGKMKPLAMADLESYLMLMKQFLNIGKPFYIEGIGTLQKITDGTLQFTPGEYISARVDTQESSSRKQTGESKKTDLQEGRGTTRKTMIVVAAIATLALIGWGGYYFYQMNSGNNNANEETLPIDTLVTPVPDTPATTILRPDSTALPKDTTKVDTSSRTTVLKADTTLSRKPVKKIKKLQPVQRTDSASSMPAADTPTSGQ